MAHRWIFLSQGGRRACCAGEACFGSEGEMRCCAAEAKPYILPVAVPVLPGMAILHESFERHDPVLRLNPVVRVSLSHQ